VQFPCLYACVLFLLNHSPATFLMKVSMPFVLAFDVAIDPVARATGINALALFLPIFIIETLVLWILRWGSLGRSALAGFLMNAATTLLGAILRIALADSLPVAFVLSVIVEAVVLILIGFTLTRSVASKHAAADYAAGVEEPGAKKSGPRSLTRSVLSALAANVVSYAMLLGLLFWTTRY
jgi:hypothetical protein